MYRPPEWLIEVTTQTAQLKVSPSFRLGEFAPADEGGRHFIALDPRLVQFLEALRVAVQAESDKERPIRILRAYISPAQRKRLEKAGVIYAEFSRYQYGDAAAIVADGDGDGRIDDLDGDGAITSRDADWLADLCAETQSKLQMFGGIGVARSRKDPALPDTPYVDIDLRGVQQRW
ncbi:MAG: hypothetical protein BWZ10_02519 [candidate division BRC1 bacterium ADurb.BinA364]|nr:MAG: hypothetical protein BWZ10_02519 [candidate division BRC1 bacterium ADurb.BinA364]